MPVVILEATILNSKKTKFDIFNYILKQLHS